MSSKTPERLEIAAHEVMKRILPLTHANFVGKDQVIRIARELNIKDVHAKVVFLNELLTQVRNMPEKIYPSLEHRERLLEACLEAVDEADTEELEAQG